MVDGARRQQAANRLYKAWQYYDPTRAKKFIVALIRADKSGNRLRFRGSAYGTRIIRNIVAIDQGRGSGGGSGIRIDRPGALTSGTLRKYWGCFRARPLAIPTPRDTVC